ncbi:hypothetical protein B0H34DRAFT_673790 [Crassisporium funariophilum]|nr:hypothetical protein B0H34DRAFT_673790 [Crassisporium funariophilum]
MARYNLSKADSNMGAAVILGLASLMLLFTCVSSPVIATMRMYRISTNLGGAVRYVDVGLWGYCIEPIKATSYGSFVFDPNVEEGCSKSWVGFSLDDIVATALHAPELEGLYAKSHTASLIFYPIVTALSILACILQTAIHLSRRTRHMGINISSRDITRIFCYSSFTTFLVLVAFVIQISVVATAKTRVNNIRRTNPNLAFHWGNTIWLTAIAIICHLIDLFVLYGMRRSAVQVERQHEIEKASKESKNKGKKPKATKVKFNDEQDKAESGDLSGDAVLKPDGDVPAPKTSPPPYDLDGYMQSGKSNHVVTKADP